jgi:tetratricopeptide (TPR) repeat protein
MRKLAETSVAIFPSSVRHPARRVLGLLSGILEGEIARVSGDLPSAITAFERAVRLDDELEVDEPEPLPFPARHWLGAALLEARRPLDAERVYREDLRQHPHNGWALVGLQLALRAQGKSTVDVDEDDVSYCTCCRSGSRS